jgi:hypothetical protein
MGLSGGNGIGRRSSRRVGAGVGRGRVSSARESSLASRSATTLTSRDMCESQ